MTGMFVRETNISSTRILSILSPPFARVSFMLFLACCAAVTAAHPLQAAAAPPLPNGPDIQVNASTTGGQSNPQVAVFSDGRYSIASNGIAGAVIRSDVEADVESRIKRNPWAAIAIAGLLGVLIAKAIS